MFYRWLYIVFTSLPTPFGSRVPLWRKAIETPSRVGLWRLFTKQQSSDAWSQWTMGWLLWNVINCYSGSRRNNCYHWWAFVRRLQYDLIKSLRRRRNLFKSLFEIWCMNNLIKHHHYFQFPFFYQWHLKRYFILLCIYRWMLKFFCIGFDVTHYAIK